VTRPVAVLGAPSSIGIKPYDDGRQRRLDLAPGALRAQGLVARLGARDLGDVAPPPYEDFARRGLRPRNEAAVGEYSRALAARVAAATAGGSFALVLGGDCSILLGCLLGARSAGPIGLAYVDAHGDFAAPEESPTGSVAAMGLALAVGRGDSPLASLAAEGPLVAPEAVALLGRRDPAEPSHAALAASAILDLPHTAVRQRGPAAAARAALDRLEALPGGFWVHLDADLFDPTEIAAVDTPEPDGLHAAEVVELLAPLARHPRALGMEVTIYDPSLDPERQGAAVLADTVARALGG
jgi:arginase